MLFLTDVNHVSSGKANETRQINLPSATASLQVVIGLCKRKETAALKSKPPFQMGVSNGCCTTAFFLLPSSGSYLFILRLAILCVRTYLADLYVLLHAL